jgi:FtsP/CotA-like multicopper oxidase with cupredoxin domain
VQSLRLDPDKNDPTLFVMEPIPGKNAENGGFKTNDFAKTIYTVNGEGVAWKGPEHNATNQQLAVETLSLQPGEVVRVRMLNGTDEQLMPIQVDGHKMHVIAYDGRNLLQTAEKDLVMLSPGNRCEFLIKAGAAGSYALRMNPISGEQFESNSGMVLLNISVSGAPKDMPLPTSLPVPSRDYPLISEGEIVGAPHNVDFRTVFPYTKDPTLLTGVGFEVNGELYEEKRIDKVSRRGTAEEWHISAGTDEGHPFHIHVNTFEVVQIGDEVIDPPVHMDTIWVPKGKTVKIRMRFKQFVGKTVYHCHILIHEDTGMMQNLMIQ